MTLYVNNAILLVSIVLIQDLIHVQTALIIIIKLITELFFLFQINVPVSMGGLMMG